MGPVLKILTAWKGGITKTTTQSSCLNNSKLMCTKVVALSEGRQHKEGLKPIPCNARRFEDWEITKVD